MWQRYTNLIRLKWKCKWKVSHLNNAKTYYKQGMIRVLTQGTVSLPTMIIQSYKKLGLNEIETMLLIHIWTFREKEQITFPTVDQICSRMSASVDQVISALQKLLKSGFLVIDDKKDADTGMQYEEYNLEPLMNKLAEYYAEQQTFDKKGMGEVEAETENSIFTAFENEFGRPLSPMECETIANWIDQDHYSEALIRAALKESVFSGKVNFRYIDRILLEWSRNRVRTPEEAKAYAQRFRS